MQHGSRLAIGVRAAFACALGCSLFACAPDKPPEDLEIDLEGRPRIRVPDPIQPAGEGESANLLQHYAKRERIEAEEPSTWDLPFKSKRIAVALLITAAKDRVEDLPLLFTADATWGLPDTRQLGERPIFAGDGGETFMQAFRTAAQRFPSEAHWENRPLTPGPQEAVRTGAEPMWSYWENLPERIYIREIVRDGRAWIDYVGFFETLPDQPIRIRSDYGLPPDLTPPLRRPDGSLHHTGPPRTAPRPSRDRVEIRERP